MSDLPSTVEGLDVNQVEDGLVVYDASRDRIHYLNATAAAVFTLCDGTRSRQGIVEAVAIVFGPNAVAPSEVDACITQLEGEGVVQ